VAVGQRAVYLSGAVEVASAAGGEVPYDGGARGDSKDRSPVVGEKPDEEMRVGLEQDCKNSVGQVEEVK
jgi:hypothetical protein